MLLPAFAGSKHRSQANAANSAYSSVVRVLRPRGLQVGVAVELGLIETHQFLGLGDAHPPVPDGPLAVPREGWSELGNIVLHIFEHLVGRVALDDFLDPPAALIVEADVHDMGVAEQV